MGEVVRGTMAPEPVRKQAANTAIYPMQYRMAPGIPAARSSFGAEAESGALVAQLTARVRGLEQELETHARGVDAGIEQARREATERARADMQAAKAAVARALEKGITEFARARDRYLADVEREVVRLALAIAARVLRREAMMDPLLLSGAVRVALGQLSDATEVKLRVPVAEQAMWSEMLRLMPNLPIRPEVIGDAELQVSECRVETRLGSVDLGVKSQLSEIERGFFDLLEKREAAATEYPAKPLEAEAASGAA